MGEPAPPNGRFFNEVFRAARNEADFRTETRPCRNSHLEDVTRSLEICQTTLDESEMDETQLILRQIYSLLMHCTGLLAPPDEAERARSCRMSGKSLGKCRRSDDVASRDCCKGTERRVSWDDPGDPRSGPWRGQGDWAEGSTGYLQRLEISSVAVLARSVRDKTSVARWLEQEGFNCPVLLPAKVAEAGFLEHLICSSWPGSGNFRRVMRKFAAPEISLLAYPYECRWMHGFLQESVAIMECPVSLHQKRQHSWVSPLSRHGLSGMRFCPWPPRRCRLRDSHNSTLKNG